MFLLPKTLEIGIWLVLWLHFDDTHHCIASRYKAIEVEPSYIKMFPTFLGEACMLRNLHIVHNSDLCNVRSGAGHSQGDRAQSTCWI